MIDNVDLLIKKAVKKKNEDIVCPPSAEIWDEISAKLERHRKKELFQDLKPVFIKSVATIIAIIVMMTFRSPVVAFTSRVWGYIVEVTDETFKIHRIGQSDPHTGEEEYIKAINAGDPRITEAQNSVEFQLLTPQHIPDNFELRDIEVLNGIPEQETVVFQYAEDIEESRRTIVITQEVYPIENHVTTMNMPNEDNTEIERIEIDGIDYILIKNEDVLGLLWNGNDIVYSIYGNISKKEIIEIAKSMK